MPTKDTTLLERVAVMRGRAVSCERRAAAEAMRCLQAEASVPLSVLCAYWGAWHEALAYQTVAEMLEEPTHE